MRANGVVVPSPTLDDDLGLAQRVEDLAVEELIAQARVETLDEAVLPWAARGDVGGLSADGADPLLHGLGDELRTIVGTDMAGNTAQDEQIREHVDDVDRLEPARYPNGQALVGELVDDVEHAELAPIMGTLLDEIVGPDVIGELQPLASPDPLDPLEGGGPNGTLLTSTETEGIDHEQIARLI